MFDYGFDMISNKLYEALIAYPPDFKSAQQYIHKGADIHARSKDDDCENILAQIILGYPHVDHPDENLSQEDRDAYWAQYDGRYLPEIVRFFLANGFDVTLDHQRFGADCLRNLSWSSYDRYILDATKLLLSAGASYTYEDEDQESVIEWIGTKASLSTHTDGNAASALLFCTMWDILDAHRKGEDYTKIDSCLCCIGEKINQVLASKKPTTVTVEEILPSGEIILCDQELHLICGEQPLRISNYAEIAVDPRGIHNPDLIDVSTHFSSIIGKKIENILFPYFSEKSDGIQSPDFVINLEDGISMQCRPYRIDEHWKLAVHLMEYKKTIQDP